MYLLASWVGFVENILRVLLMVIQEISGACFSEWNEL